MVNAGSRLVLLAFIIQCLLHIAGCAAADADDSREIQARSAGDFESIQASSAEAEPALVRRGAYVIGEEGYDPDKGPGYDDLPGQPSISPGLLSGPTTLMEKSEGTITSNGMEAQPVPTEYPIGQYVDYRFYWSSRPEGLIRFTDVSPHQAMFKVRELDADTQVTIRLDIDSPDHLAAYVEYTIKLRNRLQTCDWEISWGRYDIIAVPKCDRNGNVYAFGIFSIKDTDFDPGPGEAIYSPLPADKPMFGNENSSPSSYFLSKFDRDGKFQWVKIMGRGFPLNSSPSVDMEIDDFGNMYLVGDFQGTVDLDPGPAESIHGASNGFLGTFLSVVDPDGNLLWTRVWGEDDTDPFYPKCLELDGKGGIYVAGTFLGTAVLGLDGPYEVNWSMDREAICVMKLKTDGAFQWVKTWGGKGEASSYFVEHKYERDSYVIGIECDQSGDIYITGMVNDSVDLDPGPGVAMSSVSETAYGYPIAYGSQIFLSRFNPDGNMVWCRLLGGELGDCVGGMAITDDSNIVISGLFTSTTDFGRGSGITAYSKQLEASGGWTGETEKGSAYLASYSPDNALNWIATWDMPYQQSGGWCKPYFQGDLTVNSDGTILVSGAFWGTRDFDPGEGVFEVSGAPSYTNLYVSRFESSGHWKSVDTWTTDRDIQSGAHLTSDNHGNAYLAFGTYRTTFLRKYSFGEPGPAESPNADSTGVVENPVARRIFEAPGPAYSRGFNASTGWVRYWPESWSVNPTGVVVDHAGNVYVTGSYSQWGSQQPPKGFENVPVYGDGDVYLMKIGPESEDKWIRSWGGPNTDRSLGIYIDDAGRICVIGTAEEGTDFDPGPGTDSPPIGAGHHETVNYRSKFDTNGNYQGVDTPGSSGGNDLVPPGFNNNGTGSLGSFGSMNQFNGLYGTRIEGDEGSIYLIGAFQGTKDFDPGAGTVALTSSGSRDMFFAKYDHENNLQWVHSFESKYYWSSTSVMGAIRRGEKFYVMGMLNATVDFDPGPGEKLLLGNGCSRTYIAAFDDSGGYIWGFSFGNKGPQSNIPRAMALDDSGAIYVVGWFNGRTDFCPGEETHFVEAGHSQAGYLLKVLPDGTW